MSDDNVIPFDRRLDRIIQMSEQIGEQRLRISLGRLGRLAAVADNVDVDVLRFTLNLAAFDLIETDDGVLVISKMQ